MSVAELTAIIILISLIGGIFWKFFKYLANIEKNVTNHLQHQIADVDAKVSKIEKQLIKIEMELKK